MLHPLLKHMSYLSNLKNKSAFHQNKLSYFFLFHCFLFSLENISGLVILKKEKQFYLRLI